MKLAIVGCRTFNDYKFVKDNIINFYNINDITQIISGGATGVGSLAKQFAEEYQIDFKEFQADWNTYGKAAGPIRNRKIIENATHIIAFWDYKSRGTKSSINIAIRMKKILNIVDINYNKQ